MVHFSRAIMRTLLPSCLVFVALGLAQEPPAKPESKREGAAVLLEADRLFIREAQLVIAQAHINHLQAEAQVRQAEENLNRLLQSLKSQYACLDCELNADFTWTKKPAPSETKPATPAPKKASGPTSNKE